MRPGGTDRIRIPYVGEAAHAIASDPAMERAARIIRACMGLVKGLSVVVLLVGLWTGTWRLVFGVVGAWFVGGLIVTGLRKLRVPEPWDELLTGWIQVLWP